MVIRSRIFLLAVSLVLTGGVAASAQAPVPARSPLQLLSAFEPPHQPGSEPHAAEEHNEAHGKEPHHEEPSDLFLSDFFKSGWTERFEERERDERAPRFNLIKSRQGFLERVGLVNYSYASGLENRSFDEHEASAGLEWALNRRFQLGVESLYAWQRPNAEEGKRGSGLRWDFSTRLQLIDTSDRAYNCQLHVVTPQSHLDAPQTELAFALAGFEDLTKTLGLYRVGLYHHVEYVALLGPRDAGEERRPANLMRYDVSIAKTLIEPTTPLIADFTVFFETFGETRLDGSNAGRTDLTFTPGMRFNPTGRKEKAWWVQAGIEFPVTGPRLFNERIIVSLIHDF